MPVFTVAQIDGSATGFAETASKDIATAQLDALITCQ